MKSHLWFFLILLSWNAEVSAAGTITLRNSVSTKMQLFSPAGRSPVPTNFPVLYGVFWGTNPNNLTLVLPTGTSSTTIAGMIDAPTVYPVSGTQEGQVVYLRIRGWDASFGTNWSLATFAETEVRTVALGPELGPGPIIWGPVFSPLTLTSEPRARVSVGLSPNFSLTVEAGSGGNVVATVPIVRESNTLGPLDFATTVMVTTTNLSAVAGVDYVATSEQVTFPPHEILRYLNVPVLGNPTGADGKQFGVKLVPVTDLDAPVFVVNIRKLRVTEIRRESERVLLRFASSIRQRYALEASTDLNIWSVVPGAQELAGTGGTVEAVDASTQCCEQRFYRLRILP